MPFRRSTHPAFRRFPLSDTGVDGYIDWLVGPDPDAVAPRASGYMNAHVANLAMRRGSTLGPAMEQLDLVVPDGMSVVRAACMTTRVSSADFFPRFLWAAAALGRTLAFVGGAGDLAARCAAHLSTVIPSLRVVLVHHGFIAPGTPERRDLCARLRELRPAVTLLGLGSPQQELFALECRDELRLPTTWCVGALFEYFVPGVRPRAPLWMRRSGFEWAFRFAQEPRRLAGRYVLGNAEFLLRTRGYI